MFEYISPDGTALPENEVIKLAKESFTDINTYIKKNKLTIRPKQKKKPEVKKEVAKPIVKKEIEEVAINKPIYLRKAEEAVELSTAENIAKEKAKGKSIYYTPEAKKAKVDIELAKQGYFTEKDLNSSEELVEKLKKNNLSSKGLLIEQIGFGTDNITLRGAGGEKLGVSADKQFAIDLPAVRVGSDLSKEERKQNAEILNKYISDYGDVDYIEKSKAKYGSLYKSIWDKTKTEAPTQDQRLKKYLQAQEEEYARAKQLNTGPKSGLSFGGSGEVMLDSKFKERQETGSFAMPSQATVNKWWNEEEKKRREAKLNKAQADLPMAERTAISAINQDRILLENKSTEELSIEGNELKKRVSNFTKSAKIFNENPTSVKEFNQLKREEQQLVALRDEFNKKVQTQKSNYARIGAITDTALDDYDRLSQTGSLLKNTALSVIAGAADLLATGASAQVAAIESLTTNKPFSKSYKETKTDLLKETFLDPIYSQKKDVKDELDLYQKDLNVGQIESVKDFGRWAMGVTTQMPSSLSMAMTGPAAMPLFFLSSYGEKSYELAQNKTDAALGLLEIQEMIKNGEVNGNDPEITKEVSAYKKTLNLSEGQEFTSKMIAGIAEAGFERLGSIGILKRTADALRAIPKSSIKQASKALGGQIALSIPVESATETLTQLSNNIGDIYVLGENKNVFEGVPDAAAAGAFMGPGFAIGGAYKGMRTAIASEVVTKAELKQRASKVKELEKMLGLSNLAMSDITKTQVNGLDIDPRLKEVANEIVDQLENEDLKVLQRLEGMNSSDIQTVGDINQQLRKVQQDWQDASMDGELDFVQLEGLKDYYKGKWKSLQEQRETILNKGVTAEGDKIPIEQLNFEELTGSGILSTRQTKNTYLNAIANFKNLSKLEKDEYLEEAKNKEGYKEESKASFAAEVYADKQIEKLLDANIEASNVMLGEGNGIITVKNIEELQDKEPVLWQALENDRIAREKNGEKVDYTTTNGFKAPDGRTVILKDNAIKNKHTSTGSHEALHVFTDEAIASPSGQKAMKDLQKYLEEKQPNFWLTVKERLKAYEEGDIADGQELMQAISDSYLDGTKVDRSTFNNIAIAINKASKGKLFPSANNANFNLIKPDTGSITPSGKALFDTVINYSRRAKGDVVNAKGVSKIRVILPEDEDRTEELLQRNFGVDRTSRISFSKSKVDELKDKLAALEEEYDEGYGDMEEVDYKTAKSNLETKIKAEIKLAAKAEPTTVVEKPKKEVSEESSVKEIIKENKGKISSDKVQEIYNKKGTEGALDIIKLFKPITGRIVDKRRDAPGFSESDLTYEIENGKGGILDLIMKYNPNEGVPLAAYINKYLPVRAITASRRILDKEFTSDVSEEVNIMATETADQGMTVNASEKPKYKNALESKVLSADELETVNKKILSVIRTLKSRIDAPVTLNRTVTPLIAEIRDDIGKQLDIDIKTMLGGKKDGVLKKELLRNKRYILENMTTTWLMGKDGQGGIPQAIQKKVNGQWISFPEWVGKKIDRESMATDLAGRTSGAELVRRLPNVFNNVSNEEFLAQIIGPDGNPIRGRKESVSKAMAEEIAFDIINADFTDGGPILQAFEANQERLGVEMASVAISEFLKQSDRGNIKFSKSIEQRLNEGQAELAANISVKGKGNLSNVRLALINTFPDWTKAEIEEAAIKLTPSITMVFKRFKFNKKEIPKDNLTKAIINVANYADDGTIMRNKFGSAISVAEFFSKPDNRTDLKTLDLAFMEAVIEKYGKDEAIDLLTSLWGPTVAGKTGKGKAAPVSIYNGIEDFNKSILGIQNNTGDGKIVDSKQTYKKNNSIFKNHFDGTFNKTKDETKSNKAKELSIFAAEWFSKKILDPDNNYGNEHLAAIYTLLIKENNSVLRSAAPVAGVIKDKRIKNIKKYDYDHSKPVSYVARRLADKYVYGQDVDLEALFKDYEVTIIPKTISTKLAKQGMQSMMPLDYTEGSGAGIRISKATLQTVERYVEFIDSSSENQVTKANAIANSYSKSTKGISVFDFDDTVGLTEGSVLYTMPDDSKGKLNAEEFAKEGSKFLEEGAVFDFSEFSKVVGGKPGPMVEKMKKMIGKFGPENFFILTARPANAAGSIHEFLSSIGIDIPLENITGLGNSTAQAKADWMTGKAAEGYNDFYFADDAPQNVDAVKKALNIPGVNSKVQRAILKFSLTTKVNLDWETKFGVTSADFKVGENNYSINIASTRDYGLGEDPLFTQAFQNIADDLKLPVDYLTFNSNVKWVTFSEKTKGYGILNTGNAFEVLGIVTNALSNYVNENNLGGIAFDAKEPSRIKLYKTLASTIGSRLGWVYNTGNLNSKSGGALFVLTPAKSNTLENQPKPVKDVLNVVDVKSPRQQAKLKFSKTLNSRFNDILQENVGLDPKETFSDILAKRKGAAIGKYRFFVPPSAADFELLLYDFLGRGKVGERQYKFFVKALLEPYSNGIALIDAAKQSIKNDYAALKKAFPDVNKKLGKLTPDGNFTYDQALRVSMWNSMGVEIPGLDQTDITSMVDFVNNDASLSAFKAGLIATGRQGNGWVEPSEYWDSETIISDLHNITEKVGRKKYLTEFIDNSKEIFTPENLNRIETIYGSNFRSSLEDILYRMANGTNRESGPGRINAAWLNWINNSTAAIMFFNTKSALLQTIGSINYLNWRENNPLSAAKAFANQPQYWKDFAKIFNSDKIKERRAGLKEDVSSAEIANAAEGTKNKANAVISYLLKKGFMPTQIADSFAIAMGGASFYRNKVNAYVNQGMELDEAEAQAWKDFSKVTDETQQSGDPRDISQQQASVAGRLVLAFQNTPMQQARLIKKSALDLINGRGDAKTHISKIVYYTAVQNIIFGALQSALFTVIFDDEDEDEEKAKKKTAQEKWIDIANGICDTLLRGSGLAGAVVATIKNVAKRYLEEEEKGFKADYGKVLIEAANIAPPLGSKFQKAFGAMRTAEFEKDVIKERGWSVTQDGRLNLSPIYSVTGQAVEAATNLPLNRLVTKVENVSEALDSRNKSWQRIAIALGYKPYIVGAKNEEADIIKAKAKVQRKEEGKIKARETRERKKRIYESLSYTEQAKIDEAEELRKEKLEDERERLEK
jgi:hypothetical protein